MNNFHIEIEDQFLRLQEILNCKVYIDNVSFLGQKYGNIYEIDIKEILKGQIGTVTQEPDFEKMTNVDVDGFPVDLKQEDVDNQLLAAANQPAAVALLNKLTSTRPPDWMVAIVVLELFLTTIVPLLLLLLNVKLAPFGNVVASGSWYV